MVSKYSSYTITNGQIGGHFPPDALLSNGSKNKQREQEQEMVYMQNMNENKKSSSKNKRQKRSSQGICVMEVQNNEQNSDDFSHFQMNVEDCFSQQLKKMEDIFTKLAAVKDFKTELRHWCRQNGIKVSFTANMTFTKSKTIFRKLQNTYKKGFGKAKNRWLENELKLFHFAALGVSVLNQLRIDEFTSEHWQILEEAFPNKLQPILEYEAKNFTINKNTLKQRWQEGEDELLTTIIREKEQEPRWNEVAIQLYIRSSRLYFRNGKQCRQRWLNHLDTSIKHEKWSEQEDMTLMKGIIEHGKKWSRIMKCFDNQRTEHMIKNRFLSLMLKCKKMFPFIQDEETAIKRTLQEMGICQRDQQQNINQFNSQRELRSKISHEEDISNEDNISQSLSGGNEEELPIKQEGGNTKYKEHSTIIVCQPLASQEQTLKFNNFTTLPTPSPTAFISPVTYMSYSPIFPTYGYFGCYMNDFYHQLGSGPTYPGQQ